MRLTIGMPVYKDYCGVWETIQGLRTINAPSPRLGLPARHWLRDAEVLIVDNCPDSDEGKLVHSTWQGWWAGPQLDLAAIRYVPMPAPVGAANAKQRVFEEARGEIVLCVDSHVLLWPGAIEAVLEFYADPAHARDMLTGPMVYDNMQTISTHFEDRWRGQMWGTWATDPRGLELDGRPFEIPANGCGCIAMRKDAWVGFNPKFLGFGGEEWYIHEKVRRAGGRVLCHPALRWVHRFGRPGGVKYPLNGWNKCRNYVIGLTELGISPERLYKNFVLGIDEAGQGEPERQASPPYPMDEVGWKLLTADPADPPEWPPDQALPPELGGQTVVATFQAASAPCPPQSKRSTLEALFERAASTASDINEHCPTLRALATGANVVVEFGCRQATSTVALLAGQPRVLITHDIVPPPPVIGLLADTAGDTKFEYRQASSLDCDIPECDLLFIDTVHTERQLAAELARHGPKAERIALHDTVTFGQRGEDGGPGLLPAVLQFLAEHPEWFIATHAANNHGFTILSRTENDRPPAPIKVRAPGFGPGTELKSLLATLGIAEQANCTCNARADQMDMLGPDGCQERLQEIANWLREGQQQWGWAAKLAAAARALGHGVAFHINWFDPFPGLVAEAIRRARMKGDA